MKYPSDQHLIIERGLLWLSYLLALPIITAPLAALLSLWKLMHYKRMFPVSGPKGAAIELLATHHEWLLRSLAVAAVLVMAGFGLAYYAFGFVILAVAVTWWAYRFGRGIVALVREKPMPAVVCTTERCYGPAVGN